MTQAHALGLTLLLEGTAAAVLLTLGLRRRGEGSTRMVLGLLGIVLAASALTHPIAWNANAYWLRAWPRWPRMIAIETAVVLAEAALLSTTSSWVRRVPFGYALGLSLATNATSFGYGLVLLL